MNFGPYTPNEMNRGKGSFADKQLRRMATNRIITIAIITILVLLIFAVIYSKFK